MASLRLRGLAYHLCWRAGLSAAGVAGAVTAIKMRGHLGQRAACLGSGLLLQLINEAVSFGVVVLLFVGLMRIGSGCRRCAACCLARRWGRCCSSRGQKRLLALYLTRAAVVSAYGAAGSLVVFLMWMYFSSAVLLFAASCARALPRRARPRRGDVFYAPWRGRFLLKRRGR